MQRVDSTFWAGKSVLLTGHTGFKGAWLALWLHQLGAKVYAVALPPLLEPSLFTLARVEEAVTHHTIDIQDSEGLSVALSDAKPEIVFHLAAQALVLESYREPQKTFATNVQGTVNLLEAARRWGKVKVFVAITTDKVYENLVNTYPYRESDVLGGHDPYSASKAACEIVIASYRASFLAESGTAVASARAGNVIGGGDWSADRLLPDGIRAWSVGRALHIRSPKATRPWQHVLEPLAGYLMLAQKLYEKPELAGAYNFGPLTHETATVRTVIEHARDYFGRGEVTWGDGKKGPHEAVSLALEISKARNILGLKPRWGIVESVRRSVDWYREQLHGADARKLCMRDIEAFEADAYVST